MNPSYKKEIIKTEKAPEAIGPYSVGVRSGPFIYTAGQIGIIPEKGEIISGGIEAETRQVFKNLAAILEAAGSSLDHVVKTTVFLQDMNDFSVMNAIYAEHFTDHYPARSAVQVAKLPKGALIEIEAIAAVE